ncbi:hypothetical protein J2X31_003368 [Flavobacterium arsenatis]|uniref:DUF3667 domain-containing protein n=1 Tax=Flavobacterium arsenatis TaxID=1484332 RepID=A0ABU1TTY6_9FLAO|nr:DUF3667 domain-containing protein [Flavobacterium arsenatis]MDR6969338.1 hypothetical protein [Flavobacterium arsenatis]
MKSPVCLNCNEAVEKKYCSNCGQKTDTHPITFKHFIMHDVLHGVWHLEKGILFTLKEVFKRPGQAALDYIKGKRIRYYNVFYLALLIIAIDVVLLHYKQKINENFIDPNRAEDVGDFLANFSKIALFSIVPLLAMNAMLFFKRLRLNFAQHLIISGISLLGMLLISILYFLTDFLNHLDLKISFGYLEAISFFLIPFFPIWTYYNATRKLYSFMGFSWRILLFYIILFIQLIVILKCIALLFYDGKIKMDVML